MDTIKKVILGGGCFWCTEAIFRASPGVINVKSGFSGGFIKNPAYREVCTGRTGHAEVVEITYNPVIISLEELLMIHLRTHNPTTLHQQGADKGTQYRSIIFYSDEEEKQIAVTVLSVMQAVFNKPIVTELKPFVTFYEAESRHQNYYSSNIDAPYCQFIITPKLNKLKLELEKLKLNDKDNHYENNCRNVSEK